MMVGIIKSPTSCTSLGLVLFVVCVVVCCRCRCPCPSCQCTCSCSCSCCLLLLCLLSEGDVASLRLEGGGRGRSDPPSSLSALSGALGEDRKQPNAQTNKANNAKTGTGSRRRDGGAGRAQALHVHVGAGFACARGGGRRRLKGGRLARVRQAAFDIIDGRCCACMRIRNTCTQTHRARGDRYDSRWAAAPLSALVGRPAGGRPIGNASGSPGHRQPLRAYVDGLCSGRRRRRWRLGGLMGLSWGARAFCGCGGGRGGDRAHGSGPGRAR